MADPLTNAPVWLQVLVSSGAVSGLYAGVRSFAGWLKKRSEVADIVQERTIGSLEASLAHERAERARERSEHHEELERERAELHAVQKQMERERNQAAGVTLKIRADPAVPDDLADDMPTAVRDRADLIAGPRSVAPKADPELDARLKRYNDGVATPVPAAEPEE